MTDSNTWAARDYSMGTASLGSAGTFRGMLSPVMVNWKQRNDLAICFLHSKGVTFPCTVFHPGWHGMALAMEGRLNLDLNLSV